jgi:hypothetical protein
MELKDLQSSEELNKKNSEYIFPGILQTVSLKTIFLFYRHIIV